MEVKAKARYIRMSPKKVRLVIDVIRGMKVDEALNQLRFINKAAVEPVQKLLNSAIANAEHNNQLKRENLYIKKITADGGPVIHRWRARAFGRAAPIRKRMSHIYVVLDEVGTDKKAEKKPATPIKKVADKKETASTKKASAKKNTATKKSIKKSAEPKGEAPTKKKA